MIELVLLQRSVQGLPRCCKRRLFLVSSVFKTPPHTSDMHCYARLHLSGIGQMQRLSGSPLAVPTLTVAACVLCCTPGSSQVGAACWVPFSSLHSSILVSVHKLLSMPH